MYLFSVVGTSRCDVRAVCSGATHTKWCLHCGKEFNGHAVRVWQDEAGHFWLECGTPDCDGSPIDWADYPWWDEKHPATRQYLKRQKRPKRKNGKKNDDADDIPW